MKKLAIICTLICAVFPGLASSKQHALLIGVTDYAPEITALAGTLSGPANDVALMAEVFENAGLAASDTTILTDSGTHASSAQKPTRVNILKELDRLTQVVKDGDQVIVYFAGHGAQVPAAADTDEPDGLDEVFLPSDFRIPADGVFENLIRDDEIGSYIDAMIAAGADVWMIADTCHSGSLRRSAGADAVARFVSLTRAPPADAQNELPFDTVASQSTRAGQFVGFYGARAGALAYETKPHGVETTHGLMTWTLAHALRSAKAQTYSDLARMMSAQLWQIGNGLSEPVFTGAMGADYAFASVADDAPLFSVVFDNELRLQGGRIDGLVPGTRVQIEDGQGNPLFESVLRDVALSVSVSGLPTGFLPLLDARIKTDGLNPAQFRNRWLADRGPSLIARVLSVPLDIALPVGLSSDGYTPELQDQIAALISSLAPALQRDDTNPAIRIVAEGSRLFLRPSSPGAQAGMSVPAEQSGLPALEVLLRRAAKTRGLLQAANALSDTNLAETISVTPSIVPGKADGQGGCLSGHADPQKSTSDTWPPVVGHCETVVLTVRNQNPWPVDLSPFYLAADNQVYYLTGYEGAEKGGWRIPPGGQGTLTYTEATQSADGQPIATGPMHVVLFGQRGAAGADPVDFRYLQDNAPPVRTRGGNEQGLASVLTAAGFGLVNRRSIGDTARTQSGAWIMPLLTRPQSDGGQFEHSLD